MEIKMCLLTSAAQTVKNREHKLYVAVGKHLAWSQAKIMIKCH